MSEDLSRAGPELNIQSLPGFLFILWLHISRSVTLLSPHQSPLLDDLAGFKLRLSGVVRVRSRKNNSYFVSSPLTRLTVSAALSQLEGRAEGGLAVVGGGEGGGEVVEGVGGLETLTSLDWSVVCGGCGSQVTRATCTYVGCGVVASFQYTFRYRHVILNVTTNIIVRQRFVRNRNITKKILSYYKHT